VAGKVLEVDLPADSLNTLVLPASALA
jgi:hypothetical protein